MGGMNQLNTFSYQPKTEDKSQQSEFVLLSYHYLFYKEHISLNKNFYYWRRCDAQMIHWEKMTLNHKQPSHIFYQVLVLIELFS